MINKKALSLLLKFVIAFIALYFLYNQFNSSLISNQLNQYNFLDTIQKKYLIIIIVFLMMFLNWILESIKWRFLIYKIEKVSLITSIRAVFSGITVSAFTPNRVGEYGGRVFCLDKANRIQAVIITIIGSISQLIITILFGSIGLICLPNIMPDFSVLLNSIEYAYSFSIFVLFFLNVIFIILFLNTSMLSVFISRIKVLQKYQKYSIVFSFYTSKELFKVLLFSAFRYLVFTSQFFILLLVFGVSVNYTDAMILISTMLLAISIIPSIAITELGVRGSIAVFLFSLVSSNTAGIMSATFLMWIINLLIPSIIGVVFIFTLRFFRK